MLAHGIMVVIVNGNNLWPMFFFGFGSIFVIIHEKEIETKWTVESVAEPVVSLRLSRHLFLACPMVNRQECAVFS